MRSCKQRIEACSQRCGFKAPGACIVMDGSRRSSHGNAYFTGFGTAKRIVFFDTLLSRLDAERESRRCSRTSSGTSSCATWSSASPGSSPPASRSCGCSRKLMNQPWFYTGLDVQLSVRRRRRRWRWCCSSLVVPLFIFLLHPLRELLFAQARVRGRSIRRAHSVGARPVSALVKLYEDNAATLTPDPLHSVFYDSHPPATRAHRAAEKFVSNETPHGRRRSRR